MRILFITQWFEPENVPKGLAFAKELKKLGHEVQILTGFPNYPTGIVFHPYKIKFLQKEYIEGVSVIRVPLYPSHDRSSLRRIVNYASFALSAASIGVVAIKKPDIAYVYHPPLTVSLPAIVMRLMRGVPFVYDIQDLWPDTLPTSGMFNNRFGLKLIGALCKFTYRFADKIVVLSPGLKKVLSKRGVPDEKIEVIYNWCDDRSLGDDELDPQLVKELGLSGNFNIVFAGNIGLGQALDSVIEAASMLKTDCPSAQIVIIGQGVELDRLKTKASNLDNVIFLPPKPFKEIGAYLRQADALLLHLKDDPLFEITIPSKLQAYLAIGRPIIVGVKGSAAKLVDEAGAGLSCVPQNPSSIAKTICDLNSLSESQRKLMGQRGREFYKRTMSLEVGTKRFEKLFRSVLDSNKN